MQEDKILVPSCLNYIHATNTFMARTFKSIVCEVNEQLIEH